MVATVSMDANGKVSAVTLGITGGPPDSIPVQANTPPTSFSVLLGIIANGKSYRTVDCGSVLLYPRVVYQQATAVSAGQMPWTNYYTWLLA